MLVVGLVTIVGANALFLATTTNDFAAQFGIALSFTGQALMITGLFSGFDHPLDLPFFWFGIAILEAVIAVATANFVLRVCAAYAGATAITVALALTHSSPLSVGLLAASVALVWLNAFAGPQSSAMLRAIGYGLTLALIQEEGMTHWDVSWVNLIRPSDVVSFWVHPWKGEALVTIVLLLVVWQLLDRVGERLPGRTAVITLGVTAVVGAISFKAPGIATGLMILVLGYANGNQRLMGLGMIALLFYVSTYYYVLESTLLVKSQILASTGAVLLVARWAVLQWSGSRKEQRHA